jgi:hypothetical protein
MFSKRIFSNRFIFLKRIFSKRIFFKTQFSQNAVFSERHFSERALFQSSPFKSVVAKQLVRSSPLNVPITAQIPNRQIELRANG